MKAQSLEGSARMATRLSHGHTPGLLDALHLTICCLPDQGSSQLMENFDMSNFIVFAQLGLKPDSTEALGWPRRPVLSRFFLHPLKDNPISGVPWQGGCTTQNTVWDPLCNTTSTWGEGRSKTGLKVLVREAMRTGEHR